MLPGKILIVFTNLSFESSAELTAIIRVPVSEVGRLAFDVSVDSVCRSAGGGGGGTAFTSYTSGGGGGGSGATGAGGGGGGGTVSVILFPVARVCLSFAKRSIFCI